MNDENKMTGQVGKDKNFGTDIPYATRAATKRSALGDVSNVQTKAALNEKNLRVKSTAVMAASRLKALQPVNITKYKAEKADAKANVTKMDVEVDLSMEIEAVKHEQEEMLKRKMIPKVVVDWDDLDVEDVDDPLMVSEYVEEIFGYMKELEIKMMPSANYMSIQTELKWQMRSVLIDWIVEVHYKWKLLPETLYLAVNITDRFLSKRAVSIPKLQLVAVSALLVAAKFEEVVSPSVESFVSMTNNSYDSQEILKAERYMLHVLDFVLGYPSPMNFLRRASKADNYDVRNRTLAKYLMEVCLVDERFLVYSGSTISAAALFLAKKMLQPNAEWNRNLVHYSGYTEVEITPCVNDIIAFLSKPLAHEAVFKKYSSKKFMKASLFVQEYAIKKFGLELPLASS